MAFRIGPAEAKVVPRFMERRLSAGRSRPHPAAAPPTLRWKTRRPTANAQWRTFFRSIADFASFSPFFFVAEFVKSCEIAAQRLRKNSRTIQCAKDVEKARKICGIACGIAARNR